MPRPPMTRWHLLCHVCLILIPWLVIGGCVAAFNFR